MSVYKPKGYKDLTAAQQLIDSAPTSGQFNPYDYIDQSFYKNNKRGRMAYNEDLARLIYAAQLATEEEMNEYNSPEEQARRMREAGINPDLQSISNEPAANVAGYSANPLEGIPTNMDTASDVLGIVSGVAAIAASVISAGTSLVGLVGSVGSASAALSKSKSFMSDADTLLDSLGAFAPNVTQSDVDMMLNDLPLSGRAKRKVAQYYRTARNSPNGGIRSLMQDTKRMKAQGDFYRYLYDPKYNADPYNNFDYAQELKIYENAWKPYIEALNDAAIKQLISQSNKADYDSQVYNYTSGVAEAKYRKNQRDFYDTKKTLYDTLRQPLIKVIKNLQNGDFKSNIGTYTSAALSAYILTNMSVE